MRMMKLSISAIALIILVASVTLFAKGEKGHGKKGKCGNERIAMTQEMADQFNHLKNDFDSKLSQEDLDALNAIRNKVKSERTEIKAQISEIKALDITKEEKKSKIKEIMEANKSGKEEIKSGLKAIIENNKVAVEELASSLKELKLNNYPKKRNSDKENNKKHNVRKIAKFILHDEFVAIDNEFKEIVKDSKKLDIIVNNESLIFDSQFESNNSKFTLYDLNGNKISDLSNSNVVKGENSINLNTLNTKLDKGRYFLIIENENGISSGKFIYLK